MADPTYGKSFAQREAENSRSFLQRDNIFESAAEKDVGEQLGNLLDTSGEWSGNDTLMASRLYIDGLWLNKADEVGSWIGAAAVKAFGAAGSDKPISEIRQEMLTSLNAEQAQFYEDRPAVAIAANIVGGIMSPVGLKGGQLLSRAKDVRNSELALRSSDEVANALTSASRIAPATIRPVQATAAAGQAAGASTVGALQATGQGVAASARGGASLAQQLSGFSPQAYSILGRTPTPVLAAGAAAVEAGIIGAEGDTAGEIAKNALTSAALGAGFSSLISGAGMAVNAALRTNTAQELGRGADFVSLMFTDNFAAPVYRHVISKAFGATSFMESQARLISARIPSVAALRERGVAIVHSAAMKLQHSNNIITKQADKALESAERMADDLTAELTAGGRIRIDDLDAASQQRIATLKGAGGETIEQIQAAAAREAEISTNAVEGAFRTRAFQNSLPVGAPANLADDIQAMSPRDALQAVRGAWKTFGYQAAREAQIPVERARMTRDIESLIRNAPEYALLDSPGTVGLATRMSDYIDGILTRELGYADGIVSGKTMVDIRSDLGFAINGLSQNNPAAKAIVKPIQQYIDDLISKNLSGKAADDFAEESRLWRIKSTLEDAADASVAKGGAFSGEDWVNAVKGQDGWNAKVGKGILQIEAEASAALRNASNKGIEGVRDNSIKRVRQDTDRLVLDEQARLTSAKRVATDEYNKQKAAIISDMGASQKRTLESQGKMERLTALTDQWEARMRGIDSEIARLKDAKKRLGELTPKGNSTIFQQMFATGLISTAFGFGGAAGAGLAGGAIAGAIMAAQGLSTQSVQRILAGQTGVQRAGASLADILTDVNNRVEAKFGISTTRASAQGSAQTTREGVMFSNDTKASIRRLPNANKAQIFRAVEKSGKLEAFKAEDPGFYRELEAAAR
jgi:hypothetical protein